MYQCPHCQEKGITSWQKLTSVSFAPATCQLCHKRSYLHVMHGLIALTFWIVLTWVFIGIAWMSRSSFFLIGTFPAMYLAVNRFMLGAPLYPIRATE